MANFSFKCSLKFNFLSSFSTTRLSKYKSRCFGERDFLEKITSWACLVRSGLKTIFYCLAHSRIFLKSLFSTFAVSKGSQISENKVVSSANNLTLLFKLCVRSLIYIRKNNGPNIEPCGAPAWIVIFEKEHRDKMMKFLITGYFHVSMALWIIRAFLFF